MYFRTRSSGTEFETLSRNCWIFLNHNPGMEQPNKYQGPRNAEFEICLMEGHICLTIIPSWRACVAPLELFRGLFPDATCCMLQTRTGSSPMVFTHRRTSRHPRASQPNLPYPPLYPNPHSIPNSCPHRCSWDVMGFWTVGRGVSLSSNSQRSVSRFSPPLSTFFHWPGQRFPTNSPHGPPHFFFACRSLLFGAARAAAAAAAAAAGRMLLVVATGHLHGRCVTDCDLAAHECRSAQHLV